MPRPVIVAHRALCDGPDMARRSGRPVENTVGAVLATAAAGADAVELDVRRTRDGQLVLAHDAIQWGRVRSWPRPWPVRYSRRRSLTFLSTPAQALPAALAAGVEVRLDVKDAAALPQLAAWCLGSGLDMRHVGLWLRSPELIASRPERHAFGEGALPSDGQDAGWPPAVSDNRTVHEAGFT